jgi:hypothetical protein
VYSYTVATPLAMTCVQSIPLSFLCSVKTTKKRRERDTRSPVDAHYFINHFAGELPMSGVDTDGELGRLKK